MPKDKTPKPTVFKHGNCVLVRRQNGTVDVCAPDTGTWAVFGTERHAKWSATVYTNLSERFGRPIQADDAELYVQRMVHTYPHLEM